MIILVSFGRSIRMQAGNRVMWMLYLLGAFAGGLSMHFGMPFGPMVVPKVGA
jgi:membrane associated rhomboid family serine protease